LKDRHVGARLLGRGPVVEVGFEFSPGISTVSLAGEKFPAQVPVAS
jgi:hypothetical protein